MFDRGRHKAISRCQFSSVTVTHNPHTLASKPVIVDLVIVMSRIADRWPLSFRVKATFWGTHNREWDALNSLHFSPTRETCAARYISAPYYVRATIEHHSGAINFYFWDFKTAIHDRLGQRLLRINNLPWCNPRGCGLGREDLKPGEPTLALTSRRLEFNCSICTFVYIWVTHTIDCW